MRRLVLLLLLSGVALANSQTPAQTSPATAQTLPPPAPQSAPQLSPQAAYDQATRPLDIIRRSTQNWSEIELTALKAARAQAKIACAGRDPNQLLADDLLALAHLCAFAQFWQPVGQAASNYLAAVQGSPLPTDARALTSLATAFDYKVQASLSLDHPDEALSTAQTMLSTVPYDEFGSEATSSTLRYIHFIHSDQALALLTQRQPIVLALIRSYGAKPAPDQATPSPALPSPALPSPASPEPASTSTASTGPNPPAPAAARPTLPLHVLYADALALPWMQQFLNQPSAAAASYAQLEASLPSDPSSEDAMFIAEMRRQYALLGTHLPRLNPMGSLLYPGAPTPDGIDTRFAGATVFLLFPDWCNQCIAMAFDSPGRAKELLDFHVRFFPLIAQAIPPDMRAQSPLKDVPLPPSKPGKAPQPSSAQSHLHVDQQITVSSTPDARLAGTPTLAVPNDTLDAFAASDFPLIVAVDHDGIIRAVQLAPDDALAPGGDVDQIAQHILKTWPPA